MCGKCSTEEGTLSHQFLLCHKLQNFWCEIFDFLSKAFERDFAPAPLTALFGIVEPDKVKNKYEVQAISLSTLLARKLTLQAWKSDKPPTKRAGRSAAFRENKIYTVKKGTHIPKDNYGHPLSGCLID